MNNSYSSYVNYIESTKYYEDLSNALTKIETIFDNIDSLINALGRPNGINITSAINDLESFKTKLNNIFNYYNSLKKNLNDNASEFDKTLAWAKSEFDGKKHVLYYYDGDIISKSEISFDFLTILNIYGNTYKAVKTVGKNNVKICNTTGYIMHIQDISSICYTLKPNLFSSTKFNISTGQPKDIVVGTNSIENRIVEYYTKNNKKITL